MIERLNEKTLTDSVRQLAGACPVMAKIAAEHGVPPLWDRRPGFATLIHIILEQQVSLASARACFDKLTFRLGELTPENLLSLGDAELKAVGFSRQKTSYARHLAEAVIDKRIHLDSLTDLPDAEAKVELVKIKGIGEWTSDIYLLMALLRPDVMPKGDVALHSAWHSVSGEKRPLSDEFMLIAERWAPHRSTAARLLWHWYLSDRPMRQEP